MTVCVTQRELKLPEPLLVSDEPDLVDELVLASPRNRNGEEVLTAVQEDSVAVDPAAFAKGNIVEEDDEIRCLDQMEVPQVWKDIWLHDGQPRNRHSRPNSQSTEVER